jgi:hypothetical protein
MDHEAQAAENDDVRPSVRELLIDPNFRYTADGSGLRGLAGVRDGRNAETSVTGEAVRQHPAIAGLEDVKRKGGTGKKNHGQRENRKAGEHVVR